MVAASAGSRLRPIVTSVWAVTGEVCWAPSCGVNDTALAAKKAAKTREVVMLCYPDEDGLDGSEY